MPRPAIDIRGDEVSGKVTTISAVNGCVLDIMAREQSLDQFETILLAIMSEEQALKIAGGILTSLRVAHWAYEEGHPPKIARYGYAR